MCEGQRAEAPLKRPIDRTKPHSTRHPGPRRRCSSPDPQLLGHLIQRPCAGLASWVDTVAPRFSASTFPNYEPVGRDLPLNKRSTVLLSGLASSLPSPASPILLPAPRCHAPAIFSSDRSSATHRGAPSVRGAASTGWPRPHGSAGPRIRATVVARFPAHQSRAECGWAPDSRRRYMGVHLCARPLTEQVQLFGERLRFGLTVTA